MRKMIIASHGKLAEGFAHTLSFLTGADGIESLCCYLDGDEEPVEKKVERLMSTIKPEDEAVVLCDLFGGSVYQKFYPWLNEHVHLICGLNLPLAMNLVLEPDDHYLTNDRVNEIVCDSQQGILYVNTLQSEESEDDE